jgi:hypothetical protein
LLLHRGFYLQLEESIFPVILLPNFLMELITDNKKMNLLRK